MKQLRDLPNPYDNFKNFAKTGFRADPNNPDSAAAPAAPNNRQTTAKEVPMTKVEIDQSLANAKAALSRNPAARDAIVQKLRANGD
jgi:hypothetical protein